MDGHVGGEVDGEEAAERQLSPGRSHVLEDLCLLVAILHREGGTMAMGGQEDCTCFKCLLKGGRVWTRVNQSPQHSIGLPVKPNIILAQKRSHEFNYAKRSKA